ncbi:TauD/TfdA dioxygenase family protein [Sphingomonas sp. ERG5]|uniref:TauD/TfdA dioxygenase family protein n=1 Tax=Sphingomonas sp. ERG5 TaxID=1381597 RepID=UPI00068FED84|nr:TauD/TfdA family dioxygenase [Sphingomonas sp. ERG5]
MIQVGRRLHARFGVEISGVDLRSVSDDDVLELRRVLASYGLLLFPDQQLAEAEYEHFARRIGNGQLELSARRISHGTENPHVSQLTNLVTEKGEARGFGGQGTDFWHSDQEFREHPASLASLYCRLPSREGGNTSFASTAVTSLNLPSAMVERLRDLWSTRIPADTHDNVARVEVAHPVILKNAHDGREFLYHSENTRRFLNVDEEDSDAMCKDLVGRLIAHDNIYSHSWRSDDLLLYDNTQVIHRREAFEGDRWLLGAKIYAPDEPFVIPDGFQVDASEEMHRVPA